MDIEDELEIIVVANDDDTEIALLVRSPSGKKIDQLKFISEVEQWLYQVSEAQREREELGLLLN